MIEPETRDEYRNFAMGLLNYHRKNFAGALKDFSKITSEYAHLRFAVKSFLLIIYYETGAYESSFSLIDSYRHFLANDTTVADYIKKSNANFLKFYNELIKLKTGSGTIKANEFKKILKSSEYCIHKDWLIEKAEKI